MTEEFKRYDTNDTYDIHNARLAKDADVRRTEFGLMVRITFVSTCRSDRYEDLWVEANISDYHSGLAQWLKKGDIVGVRGKPAFRRYGDDNDKVSFDLLRAEVMVPPGLFAELKSRGFTPGAKAGEEKKGGKAKPAGKAAAKPTPAKKKAIVQVPDDDDELEDDEDESDE